MTQEQKAKAYDDALKRAKKVHKYSSDLAEIKRMEEIFPELAQSEDERIKKTLIDYFKDYKTQEVIGIKTFFGIPTDDIIFWLEKQGQKSAWTEADDEKLENTINALKGAGKHGSFDWLSTVTWLLTIKQRIGG